MESRERGVAALELGLILPILILLFFGMVEFGRGYNAKITVTHAAREGVRALAINPDNTSAAEGIAIARAGALAVTASASSGACPGGTVAMTVSHAFTYDIPLFGSQSIDLSSTAEMRCGG
jgi:Flp pilus assembly protein TadG